MSDDLAKKVLDLFDIPEELRPAIVRASQAYRIKREYDALFGEAVAEMALQRDGEGDG